MAGLTPRERLQPSLLDRLRDDPPDGPHGMRGVTAAQLRESVRRDLGWLLNCVRVEPPCGGRRVEDSVLCFGIPDLAGMSAEGLDADALRRALHAAILRFEPRLMGGTLSVEVERGGTGAASRTLSFRIESVLWAQPLPLRIRLDTEADLETFRFATPDEPE
ncbi:type VI secretion system baseplate subunit TssE [Luteibacter aegosomatis]|uniref:type VI secretion system baseplate subunit TssE n=1 Tax=Luteibacter aegosomatis TaxID=2911537 RepID=UPI001FF8B61C|nr:type VI secretion system baseplate subunit TssE [Luteibacter aegosomatis]UPG84779.1 type VI secretion system baseplate subunit TssE [Luteibacter aegosomatis]